MHRTVRTSHGHCVVLHSSQLLVTRLETRHHLTTTYYIYIYIYIYNFGLIKDWKRKIKDGVKIYLSLFGAILTCFLLSHEGWAPKWNTRVGPTPHVRGGTIAFEAPMFFPSLWLFFLVFSSIFGCGGVS